MVQFGPPIAIRPGCKTPPAGQILPKICTPINGANRTTPEYHDVNHGVAVGLPRRFCVIEPIAFVGGMGGWSCWTWCAVVFVVVLVHRGAGGRLTKNTSGVDGEGKVCSILFDTLLEIV
jgi:hypothetical protein